MTKYQENFISTTSFIQELLKIKIVTLLLGHPVHVLWKYSLLKFFMTGVLCTVCRAWVYLLYPLPTKLSGYIGFTMAVWLPSVEKWFLRNNSFSFWLTIKILHTYVDHDPRYFTHMLTMTQGGPLVILWTSNFLPFLHDNSILFWLTMMVLHTCVDHDPRRTSIEFGVKRSKVKLTSIFLPFA